MTDFDGPITPPTHGPRAWGAQHCMYTPDGGDDCGKPGTWHVMWDGRREVSHACDDHMELILARWAFLDRHRTVPECGMPGSVWRYFNDRCLIGEPGTAEEVAAREVIPA